jgi:glycopeptide antibiotics resistance protein
MKKIIFAIGIILILYSSYHLLQFVYYLMNSFDLTASGYGILAGQIVIFILGIVLVKKSKKKK